MSSDGNTKMDKYLEQTEDDQWDKDFIFESAPTAVTTASASTHSAVGSGSGSGKEYRMSKKAQPPLSTDLKRRSRPRSKRTPLASMRKVAQDPRLSKFFAESPSASVQSSSASIISASSHEQSVDRYETSVSRPHRVPQLVAQFSAQSQRNSMPVSQRKSTRLPASAMDEKKSEGKSKVGATQSTSILPDFPLTMEPTEKEVPSYPPLQPPSSVSSVASLGVATPVGLGSPDSSSMKGHRRVHYDHSVQKGGGDRIEATPLSSDHPEEMVSPMDSITTTKAEIDAFSTDDDEDFDNISEDAIPNIGFDDSDYRRSFSISMDDTGRKGLLEIKTRLSVNSSLEFQQICTPDAEPLGGDALYAKTPYSRFESSSDFDNGKAIPGLERSQSINSLSAHDMPWKNAQPLVYSSRKRSGSNTSMGSRCSTPTSVYSDDSRIIGLDDIGRGSKSPAYRLRAHTLKNFSKSIELDEGNLGRKHGFKKPQMKAKYKSRVGTVDRALNIPQACSLDDYHPSDKYHLLRESSLAASDFADIVPMASEDNSERLFAGLDIMPGSSEKFRKLMSMGDMQPSSNLDNVDMTGFDESDDDDNNDLNDALRHSSDSQFEQIYHHDSGMTTDSAMGETKYDEDDEDEDDGDWDTMIGDSQGDIPGGYSYAAMFREAEAEGEDDEPVIAQRESLLEFLESTANNAIFPHGEPENDDVDPLASRSESRDPMDAPSQQRQPPESEESIPSETRSMLELEESMFVEAANLHLKGLLEWIDHTSVITQSLFNSSNSSPSNNAATAVKAEVRLPDGDSFFMDRILQRCENDPLNPSCIYSLEVVVKWLRAMCCAYPAVAGAVTHFHEASSMISRSSFFTQVSGDGGGYQNLGIGSHSSSHSSWVIGAPPGDESHNSSDATDIDEDGNLLHGDVSVRRLDHIYNQCDLVLHQQCSLTYASLAETHNRLTNAVNDLKRRKEKKNVRRKNSSPRSNPYTSELNSFVNDMSKLIAGHISLCRLRLHMIEVKIHLYKSYDIFTYLEKLHNIVEELDDCSHTWLKALVDAVPMCTLPPRSEEHKEGGNIGFTFQESGHQLSEGHARILENTITDIHALCLVDKLLVCCSVSPISFQPLTHAQKSGMARNNHSPQARGGTTSNEYEIVANKEPKDSYNFPTEGVPARSHFGNARGGLSLDEAQSGTYHNKSQRPSRREPQVLYNVVYELTSGTQFIDLMTAVSSPSVVRSRLSFAAFLYLQKLKKKELIWQQPMRYKLYSVKPLRENIVTYQSSFNSDHFGLDYAELDHSLYSLTVHDVENTIVQSFSDAFLQLDELRIMQLLLYEASVDLFPTEKKDTQDTPIPPLRSSGSINRRVFQFDNDNESRGGSASNINTSNEANSPHEFRSVFSHVALSIDLDQSLQERLRELSRNEAAINTKRPSHMGPRQSHTFSNDQRMRTGSAWKPPTAPKPIFEFIPTRSRRKNLSSSVKYELFSFSYQVFVRLAQYILEMSPSAALDIYEICILILSHLGWDEKIAIQKEAVMLAIKLDRREAAILHGEGVLRHLQQQTDNITEMLYMTELLAAQYMENAQYELAVKALLSAISALNNRHKLSRSMNSKLKNESQSNICYTTLDFERAVDPLLLKLGKTLLQYGSHDRAADAFHVLLTLLSERTDCVANDEKKVSILSWLGEAYLQMDDAETCHNIIRVMKAIRADKIHNAVSGVQSSSSNAGGMQGGSAQTFTPRRSSKAQDILETGSNSTDNSHQNVPRKWFTKFDALGISRTFSRMYRRNSSSRRQFSFRTLDQRESSIASKHNLLKPTIQQSRMMAVADARNSFKGVSPRSNSSSIADINAAKGGLGARGFRRVTSVMNTTTIMHRYLVNSGDSNLPKFCITSHNTDLGWLIARVYFKSKMYVSALKSLTPTIIGVELLGGGKIGSRQAMIELAELYFLRGKIQFEAARSTSVIKYPFEVGSTQLFEAVSTLSVEASRAGYGVQQKGAVKNKSKRQYSRSHLTRSRLGQGRGSDTSSKSQSRNSSTNMYLTCRNTSVYRNPSDLLWDAMKWFRRAWELYHAAGDETSAAQSANFVARCHLLPTFAPHAFFEVPVEIASNLSSYIPELKVEREPAKRPAHDLGDWFVSSPAMVQHSKTPTSAGIAARSVSASQKYAHANDEKWTANTEMKPRAADIVPRFVSLDEVDRVMQFALDINLESCLPFQLMESYLNLAELNYLQGNKLDAIAFWWETKDLFLHLFSDGVLVPLVRRATLEFTTELCTILNRLVQFLWVTDRLIVNQHLFLLEMQIILTHEAERASRRYAVKARSVSRLLPQVLEKVLHSSTTFKDASLHSKPPIPATVHDSEEHLSLFSPMKFIRWQSLREDNYKRKDSNISKSQQPPRRPVSAPVATGNILRPVVRSLKKSGINSLNLYNAFDLFIARQNFDVHQDVRKFYNSLNYNMVMEKVYDFSWNQYIDYDFCSVEQAPMRRLGHSTSLQANEYGLQRAFSSSFSLIGSKSVSERAASKSSSDKYSDQGQGDLDGNSYLKQLDWTARKQCEIKYRFIPQYVLPHILKRGELIIDSTPEDQDIMSEAVSDDTSRDGEQKISSNSQAKADRSAFSNSEQGPDNSKQDTLDSTSKEVRQVAGRDLKSEALALSASIGGSEMMPSTSSSSREWVEKQPLHGNDTWVDVRDKGLGINKFNRDIPLDPFVDFAWMDESYADYSAHIRSVHSRANSKFDRNKRATEEGRARFPNLFMPEFDEAHIDYSGVNATSFAPTTSPGKSTSSAAGSPVRSTTTLPELNKENLKRIDDNSETVLIQRLWRNYLLVKNAHEQYKTRKPSMALLRHHVRSALCNISIYMYRLRAFSRQYQGSLLNYDELREELNSLPVTMGADGKVYPYDSATLDEDHITPTGHAYIAPRSVSSDLDLADKRAAHEREALRSVLMQARLPLTVFIIHIGDLLLMYRPHDGSKHVQLFGGAGYITFSRLFKEEEEEKERSNSQPDNSTRRMPRKQTMLQNNVSSHSASTVCSRESEEDGGGQRRHLSAQRRSFGAEASKFSSKELRVNTAGPGGNNGMLSCDDQDFFWSLSKSNSLDNGDGMRRSRNPSNRTSPRLSPRAGTPGDSPPTTPARQSPVPLFDQSADHDGGRESAHLPALANSQSSSPRGSIYNSVRGASRLLTRLHRKNSRSSVNTDEEASEPDEAVMLRQNSITFKPSFQASLSANQTNFLFDLVTAEGEVNCGGGKAQRISMFQHMRSGILSFAVEFLLTISKHAAEEQNVKRSTSFNIPVTISEEAGEDVGVSSSSSDPPGHNGSYLNRKARQLLKADSDRLPLDASKGPISLVDPVDEPQSSSLGIHEQKYINKDIKGDQDLKGDRGVNATAVYASRMRSRHEVSGFFISADSRSLSQSPLRKTSTQEVDGNIMSSSTFSSTSRGNATHLINANKINSKQALRPECSEEKDAVGGIVPSSHTTSSRGKSHSGSSSGLFGSIRSFFTLSKDSSLDDNSKGLKAAHHSSDKLPHEPVPLVLVSSRSLSLLPWEMLLHPHLRVVRSYNLMTMVTQAFSASTSTAAQINNAAQQVALSLGIASPSGTNTVLAKGLIGPAIHQKANYFVVGHDSRTLSAQVAMDLRFRDRYRRATSGVSCVSRLLHSTDHIVTHPRNLELFNTGLVSAASMKWDKQSNAPHQDQFRRISKVYQSRVLPAPSPILNDLALGSSKLSALSKTDLTIIDLNNGDMNMRPESFWQPVLQPKVKKSGSTKILGSGGSGIHAAPLGGGVSIGKDRLSRFDSLSSLLVTSFPVLLLTFLDFVEVSDALAYLVNKRYDAVFVFAPACIADLVALELKLAIDRHCKPDSNAGSFRTGSSNSMSNKSVGMHSINSSNNATSEEAHSLQREDAAADGASGGGETLQRSASGGASKSIVKLGAITEDAEGSDNSNEKSSKIEVANEGAQQVDIVGTYAGSSVSTVPVVMADAQGKLNSRSSSSRRLGSQNQKLVHGMDKGKSHTHQRMDSGRRLKWDEVTGITSSEDASASSLSISGLSSVGSLGARLSRTLTCGTSSPPSPMLQTTGSAALRIAPRQRTWVYHAVMDVVRKLQEDTGLPIVVFA